MSGEKEEISRLEKEIEVLERLIKNHGKQEQRNTSANLTKRLTGPVPSPSTALGNRYQWIKRDLSAECSSRHTTGTCASKSSDCERNYVLGNLSQEEQGIDMRQQGCSHRSSPKSVYKTGFGVQSVKNLPIIAKVVSSGSTDEKGTTRSNNKFQHAVSSGPAAAMVSYTERSIKQSGVMKVLSREAVVAKRKTGNNVKNMTAVLKHKVADELRKPVELSGISSSVVSQNCLVSKSETIDSTGVIIKPSNDTSRLCAINKYKLIRPVDDKNMQQVITSLPHGSQFAVKEVSSHRKRSSKSVVLTSCREDVIHKSKYKLVKSLQGSHSSSSNNILFPESSIQLSQVYGSSGDIKGQKRCLSPSADRRTSATTYLGPIKQFSSDRMHILSRYKLVKTGHAKHQHPSKENRRKRSRTRSFAQSTRKKGWISKYALKREFGEVSQSSNCINAILGRSVRNLSANKYKFINARRTSSSSALKRRLLAAKGARSSTQLKCLSWSNVPKSASSSHLNFNPSKRRSSFARSLSRLDSRRSVLGKRSLAAKTTSYLQNLSTRYCIFYSRFGHCNSGDRCPYIHDPDKISVCTRFLRGTCKVTDCPFSHKVAKHKMPMCRFFLRRACNRDDCPYSHVNVAKDAEICLEFLKGFCAEGDLCKKKHMLVCSDFSENGSCPRGKSCPMQHPKNLDAQHKRKCNGNPLGKLKPNCKKLEQSKEEDKTTDARSRNIPSLHSDVDDVSLPWKERRLPAYIALNNSAVDDDAPENKPRNPVNVLGCAAKLNIHPRIKMPSESAFEEIEVIIQQSSQES